MCNLNGYKELSYKDICVDNICHTCFMGTGNKSVMNCYKFLNLLLCYIHFLTHCYYFSVQVKVILIIYKSNTLIKSCISIIGIFFRSSQNFKGKLVEMQKIPCEASK